MVTLLFLVIPISIAATGYFLWIKRAWGLASASAALAAVSVAIVFNLAVIIALPVMLALILTLIIGSYAITRTSSADRRTRTHTVMSAVALGAIATMLVTIGAGAFMGGTAPQPSASVASAMPVTADVTAMVNGQSVDYTPSSSAGEVDASKVPATAASTITYYAYQAELGTNNMGGALHLNSAQDGLDRLSEKMSNDPLYAATLIEFDIHGEALDAQTVYNRAQGYLANRDNWKQDIATFMGNIKSADLIDMGDVTYDSLGMIPDPSGDTAKMPLLTKFSVQPAMNQTLVLHMKSGQDRFLRVLCDLQPAVPNFPKVTQPATPEKSPTIPPKTYVPPVPPTHVTPPPPTKTTPPPTTKTTPPPTTKTTPPTTTPPTTTPPTTTPPTTTPPTTTPPTTTPPTTTPPTTTPPTTTPPSTTKKPEEDPCRKGNAPDCQSTDAPVTADPTPSDPKVPTSVMPTTPSNPPPPAPPTTSREIPIPTDNQGAPPENPVTGDPGDSGSYTDPIGDSTNTGGSGSIDDSGNSNGSTGDQGTDDPTKGGSVFDDVQGATSDDTAPAAVAEADSPADSAPVANTDDSAASAPAVDADAATGEATEPSTVTIDNKAFSSSTGEQSFLAFAALIALIVLAGAAIAVLFSNPENKGKQH